MASDCIKLPSQLKFVRNDAGMDVEGAAGRVIPRYRSHVKGRPVTSVKADGEMFIRPPVALLARSLLGQAGYRSQP